MSHNETRQKAVVLMRYASIQRAFIVAGFTALRKNLNTQGYVNKIEW